MSDILKIEEIFQKGARNNSILPSTWYEGTFTLILQGVVREVCKGNPLEGDGALSRT